ncbi:MAG: DUF4345 family protein [Actinomycetes bacterium]
MAHFKLFLQWNNWFCWNNYFGKVFVMKLRTTYLGIMGVLGTVLAFAGFVAPETALGEDGLSILIMSNLRAFMAAELMMALFALYSLKNKKYQDSALIFLFITLIGWTIGQVTSYVIDGAPNTFTVVSIVLQAALIPVTWKALKSN